MKNRKLTSIVTLVFVIFLLFPVYANAATYPKIKIMLAHSGAVTDARNELALGFEEYIEEKSGGNIQVEVYPANQLGDSRVVIEAVQQGGLQVTIAPPASASQFIPTLGLMDTPYLFPTDLAKAQAILQGPFGQALLDSCEKYNIHGLTLLPDMYSAFIANKPLRTPNDFQGQKFRVMASKVSVKMIESWGASAMFLDYQETFTALQTGVVDGLAAGIGAGIYNMKFYEVVKHLMLTNHVLSTQVVFCNKPWYDGLDEATRQLVDEGIAHGAERATVKRVADEEKALKAIADSGVEIIQLTNDEMQALSDLARQPCIDLFLEVAGEKGRELVDLANGEIAKVQ